VTTFVLVPGAGGLAWYWHRLVPELERRGHTAIPVDHPAGDDTAGLAADTDTVVGAIGNRAGVVLVGQSMGGLTAPLVCERVPVELLVLVNAMIPLPGETGGEWWSVTGQGAAQAAHWARLGLPGEPDDDTAFFHDSPPTWWPPHRTSRSASPAGRSRTRGPCAGGPTSPPVSWPPGTTASSRRCSSGRSHRSGWVSMSTRYRVATWWR